ncbi:MAG: glycosyltransferase family 2 protein, partial [Pyrinomonadaceae bacterium]|nr:glycosyltransferase family 2 protein [Pyrinomonadaceae bacterium]
MKISAAIIAFNESENIAAACESVAWADEIIVVDSESTDDTRKIAESCGARVLIKKWEGFARQKQFAADSTGNDWVLSLDADERVSENLRNEILTLKKSPTSQLADGYKIPRRNRYMNRWMKHGGWYPDWQLRLYLKTKGLWKDVLVHESVTMSDDARTAKLSGDLLHHSIPNAAYHHRLLGERYAPLAARQMFD